LPLIADYERFATGQPQNLVGRTLRLTAGICARDPRQLIPQLLGRLMHSQGSVMANFLDATRRQIVPPALITQRPSLTPPSAETSAWRATQVRLMRCACCPLLALVAQQPDLTLDEIVAVMRKRRIPGSRTAVWRFFARHDFTYKKNLARRGATTA
jgi:hypothetical protein